MAKVAVFCDTYLPGYKAGGPIPSISRIIETDRQHEFRVITRNRDSGDDCTYPGVPVQQWHPVGAASVGFLRRDPRDRAWVASQLRAWRPDFYYVNSLHSLHYSFVPLLAMRSKVFPVSKLVVAPRGETSLGALSIKARKKRSARPAIKRAVGNSVTWHVSSDREERDVREWWGANLPAGHSFIVRPDLAISPAEVASVGPRSASVPVVEFASRIDRMKGLESAILLMGAVSVPYEFRVHGVVKDAEYWQECRQLAARHIPIGRFSYAGPYEPQEAQDLFSDAALLLLPTLGENFGHVISEALSVGCPVLIPDTTLWTPVLEAGGGAILKDPRGAREFVEELLTESFDARQERRAGVLAAYREWFTQKQDLRSLFGPQE